MKYDDLINADKFARENAVAPFSDYKVGAALLGKNLLRS